MDKLGDKVILSGLFCGMTVVGFCENNKPNIVLINIDDLGWADLSFQGSKYYETPNIDKLREQSMFFDNAYAGAANSAPSRACLISGQYTPRHEIYTVKASNVLKRKDHRFIPYKTESDLSSNIVTLPQALKNAGYTTCHVGKWHLGEDPLTQGMDYNFGGSSKGHPKTYFSPFGNSNLEDKEEGEYLTDRLTKETISFIDSHTKASDNPFFIYFATYAVHTPLQPKPQLKAKYDAKEKTKQHDNSSYAAMVETMDDCVGKLVKHLEESGLIENTIVIFTTDNGGVYNISRQWPLRAGKGSFYEGGIRIPLMVRWDKHVEANTTNSEAVMQMDLYPTLLDIVGYKQKGYDLDGVTLCPLLENASSTLSNRAIFWHFPAYLVGGNVETTDMAYRTRPVSVIRKGDWKLIYNYETEQSELYNVVKDISEKQELSEAEPKIAKKMYKELQSWLDKVDAPTEFELNSEYF